MPLAAKILLGVTMSAALAFGFLDPLFPDSALSLKRLHVFLFNLLAGGSLIVYHTEGRGRPTLKVALFFGIALAYAFSAAARWYLPALVLSVPLLAVVEWARISRFAVLPLDFFRPRAEVHEKFHQASLLCLSIGIAIASLVILNNEYFHWVAWEKLSLDVFFLGYSFPISLVTMSLMFSFMTDAVGAPVKVLKEACFWLVNLGVILFFAFILAEQLALEIAASTTLFVTVVAIFALFLRTAPRVQQKTFLISGMVFLLCTGITGIAYILTYLSPAVAQYKDLYLDLHRMVSLYGWNLSGLFIIVRFADFPIRLNSALPLLLHWAIVLVLAPLGQHVLLAAAPALAGYVALLGVVFFSRATARVEAR
jgi:hypothetical protein